MADSLNIETTDAGAAFDVKVVPGGSRDQIVGVLDGALKLKVAAPPEGGKANKAVIALLAKTLGVSKRDITIIAGRTNPHKRIAVAGCTADQVHAVLSA